MALAILLFAGSAVAQLTSDAVPRERLVPRREEIRRDLQESRFRLGAIRVRPQFVLRDLGYNNNVFGAASNPVGEWSATVAAGARLTLPFGPKVYLRGDVLPEYTYFQKLSDNRFLGGTYSASAVALFNRLSVEATGTSAKGLSIVSSELETPAIRRLTDVSAGSELEILRRLSVFGQAQEQTLRFDLGERVATSAIVAGALDRRDTAARAGMRYRWSSYFDVSVAAENTRTKFDVEPQKRDNSSQGVVLSLHYDRPRAYANISIADRKGKGENGSAFPGYSTTTGSYFLSYSFVAPVEVQAYGQRHVVYGVFADYPYFFETRNGGAIVVKPASRTAIRLFGEGGANDYARSAQTGGGARADDVVTYGGGAAVRLYRNITATVVVSRSDYTSNQAAFDRSILRVQTGLSFTGGR